MVTTSMGESYWEEFQLAQEDIEFLYNHLLEVEIPLTSQELMETLIDERIRRHQVEIEQQRLAGGELYQPKGTFAINQKLIFPAKDWKHGEVVGIRPGHNPDVGEFQVIQVKLEDGSQLELAAGLAEHKLNQPPKIADDSNHLEHDFVVSAYLDDLIEVLDEGLKKNPDFVRIAGRWFPRALLVDINVGHLNLAEAVLDMAGGGPLPTQALLEQIELSAVANPKLIEFSLDLALQEDSRFDEVGPAGDVLWYLRRLEPPEVLEPPPYLRFQGVDYNRSMLTNEMLALEQEIDDELSPIESKVQHLQTGEVKLIFPHWRSGTLPLSARVRHLFPTAFEAPRIRFTLVDGETGNSFPGWVVREKRYVYGVKEWYESKGVMPGTIIQIRKGKKPGEVIIQTASHRPSREWVRTVLVGSDGGIVFAMLKQLVRTPYDERMAIAIPDKEALDQIWVNSQKDKIPFDQAIQNIIRELSKLNPQGHVHAAELYAAFNIIRRCPPGPLLSLLASGSNFIHVGDLHFHLSEAESD